MSLVRIGLSVLDLDDIRAIVDQGGAVVVTFRDGSSMTFDGDHATALRTFISGLPDGIPLGSRDVVHGEPGLPQTVQAVRRKESR
jgi:hypothetical protein